ncbi:MAG: SUMF1/EgtB/PvdO family nonheme iron enzyme [Labilithrix sp.]|nr:SUMF1/EgtB/PvdO family nonheme iron enzyme [Labilithrix sp.]
MRTLSLALVGGGFVLACSSTVDPVQSDPSGTDGAVVDPTTDGGAADAKAPDEDKPCTTGSDCSSGVCGPDKKCKSPTSSDFVKNGDETDIDCGGSTTGAKPCDPGKGCAVPKDCTTGVCTGGICQVATATDGVKNGDETDTDCGGSNAPPCDVGKTCSKPADCVDKICTGGKCVARKPADGVQNGDETDIDCGGTASPPCMTGQMCLVLADCDNVLCTAGVCQPPTATDGLKNGTESDVDCGGASGVLCETGKLCNAHADCASEGCAFNNRCSVGKSCTQDHGGFTCGTGEYGSAGKAHESCCEEIFVNRPVAGGGPFYMDKYLVTAGRIRAFFDRTGGDVKTFVQGRADFPAAWVDNMPSNMAEALANVGPIPLAWDWADGNGLRARGCQTGSGGARTFYQADITPTEKNYYPQDALDEKPIQCINRPLLLAFCLWDNKDLPMRSEITYAWRGTDNRTWPWGNAPGLPTADFDTSNEYLVHKRGYMFPGYLMPDVSHHIGAPGRRFRGAGPFGHLDLAGDVFEFARDGRNNNGSWENHVPSSASTAAGGEDWRRYYAFGGRCGRR